MSVINAYKEQMVIRGRTLRDRNVNTLQRTILTYAPNNPAYKPLSINGIETYAVINSKDDYNIKEIVCMPGEKVPLGSNVVFCDVPWLVISTDIDDEVYGKGKMQRCNCVMKWKDAQGVIHSYDGVAEDATKYSEGVESTQYLRIAEFQIKVKIHLDAVSAIIGRDMRFVIDANKYIDSIIKNDDRPFVFKVTRRNIVTGTYVDDGYVEITLVQDQWIEGRDNYEEMLAAQPYELQDAYPIVKPSENDSEDAEEGGWL